MCSFWCQKCGLRPKLFLLLHLFSTFRGVHTLIFTYVPYIVIGLYKEPANFYREKRSISFVTGHLFTFVLVLSFICLVTPQILICENQTIKNKRYQETGMEYFTKVQMIVKDEGYKYFAGRATFDA